MPLLLIGLLVTVTIGCMAAPVPRSRQVEGSMAGADAAVVGTAIRTDATWRTTPYGDRLIVSRVQIAVEETLKGPPLKQVVLEMDGGTLDGVTMATSAQSLVRIGDRGIFLLDPPDGTGRRTSYRRRGVLLLDRDRVRGSRLTLADVRAELRGKP